MPTHNDHNEQKNSGMKQQGFEATDVSVSGVIVFIVALALFVGVFFIFCFGMGKVINTALMKRDGPPNKWNSLATTPSGKSKNMPNSPELQQEQLAQLTRQFIEPRLQGDDGHQDTADLHAKEDLLLDHYTWVDRNQGKLRIPIDKAMELIAERGLPIAQPREEAPLLKGDNKVTVSVPLTSGFARTGFEQQQREAVRQASAEEPKGH